MDVARLVAEPMSGSGSPRLWPGCSQLAMIRPSTSENNEAITNQPSALANTRPTEAASPMWAMPTTSVEDQGPISILIRRRKTSDMIEM